MTLVPPLLRRAQNPDKGKAGRAAEKSLAHRIGATQTPGSGAVAGAKGDMHLTEFLLENKSTVHDSFQIKRDVLYKIYGEALDVSKAPALAFQFVNSLGQSNKKDRWVCIPEAYFQELIAGGK